MVPTIPSVQVVQHSISSYFDEFKVVTTPNNAHILASQIGILFEAAATGYLEKFSSTGASDKQSILAASEYIAINLFDAIYTAFVEQYQQDFPSLLRLQQRLLSGVYAMYDILTETSAVTWIPKNLPSCYSREAILGEDAPVSSWILQMLPQLGRLSKEAPKERRKHLLNHLAQTLLAHLSKRLDETKLISPAGLDQLVLDIEFLRFIWSPLASKPVNNAIDGLVDQALRLSNGQSSGKPQDWYIRKAELMADNVGPALLNFGLQDDD